VIKNRAIDLIINTPTGHRPKRDQVSIRAEAVAHNVPLITTISGAAASVNGIEALLKEEVQVKSLQEYHEEAFGRKQEIQPVLDFSAAHRSEGSDR